MDEIIEEAKEFTNISCVVIDDFKSKDKKTQLPRYKKIPLSMLQNVNEKLHNNDVRRLDSWMVLHTNTMADLDYEVYDAATAWMEEHGDEVIY